MHVRNKTGLKVTNSLCIVDQAETEWVFRNNKNKNIPIGGAGNQNGTGQSKKCQIGDARIDQRVKGRVDVQ